MNNYSISPKKKFIILLKLMKNNKFLPTPPLMENNVTINEPQQKSELFNTFFASKSNVQGANDDPPLSPTFCKYLLLGCSNAHYFLRTSETPSAGLPVLVTKRISASPHLTHLCSSPPPY